MTEFIRRGDIYWVSLDPTMGSEIMKTRPGVIVSNNAANELSSRVIVAPITSKAHKVYPFEVALVLQRKRCKILLDQVRAIDKMRLGDKIGKCDSDTLDSIDRALKVALALP